MAKSIIRLPEVMALTGRCRSSIYGDMEAGRFPRAVKIGPRSIGWDSDLVQGWIEARIAEGRLASGEAGPAM